MGITKTLGGDRLGSGKKNKVVLHGYERSTHDKSYLWRSTMSAGTLVPFLKEVALPGDTFDIDLDAQIMTHPTIGPLFGSYKVQLDVFQAPIRLYHALLHNNAIGIGLKMDQVMLPCIALTAATVTDADDIDNSQINPSCILKYLGLSGIGIRGTGVGYREFNGVPLLAYWEIYKQYYSNKAEEIGAVIHTEVAALIETVTSIFIGDNQLPKVPANESNLILIPGEPITIEYTGTTPRLDQIYFITSQGVKQLSEIAYITNGDTGLLYLVLKSGVTGVVANSWRYRVKTDLGATQPEVVTFPLENIDKMREEILQFNAYGGRFNVTLDAPGSGIPYTYLYSDGSAVNPPSILSSQEGLAVKTYQSDLFNNWMQTEWFDGTTGINEITAIDVTDGKLRINDFLLAKKVFDVMNRIAVSGGTYDDWLDAVYTDERYQRAESPIYHGGLIKELVFQEVVSNSDSGDQPLGTLAGKGVMGKKHKGGRVRISVDEPSYIIGIISLTPRVDYSQGNDWDLHLESMDDLHKPGLDEIGFQELITEQLAWWDTTYNATTLKWEQKSAGKQPAWINYMTSVNKVYGNFAIADNEMFMTLNRRYEYNGSTIGDLTTYIDPAKFNFIFAETSLDAQNFWAQVSVDMIVRRKMSAKVMPNL